MAPGIADPSMNYICEIKTSAESTDPSPGGDVTQPAKLFYPNNDCTGKKYARAFTGFQRGLVKVGTKYFRTKLVANETLKINSEARVQEDGTYVCSGYSEPWNPDAISQLVPIANPFNFLPAKLPLKIVNK